MIVAPWRRAVSTASPSKVTTSSAVPSAGRQRAAHLAQHGGALVGGEHRRLAGMDADGDHQPVDKPAGMAHDIDMAEGDGIEAAGIKRGAGHAPR